MSLAVIAGVGLANSAAGSFLTALGLVLQQQANVRRQEKTHAQYAYAQPGVYAAEATNSASRVPLSGNEQLSCVPQVYSRACPYTDQYRRFILRVFPQSGLNVPYFLRREHQRPSSS